MNGGMKKIVVVVLSVVLSVWYSVFECVVLMNGFDMMQMFVIVQYGCGSWKYRLRYSVSIDVVNVLFENSQL